MLTIDLRGKRALVAGVADDAGFGFAIAKALAEAGASVCVGTWPPALGIFETMLERGKLDRSLALSDGGRLAFERIYPLDADYDAASDVPAEVQSSKRYRDQGDVSIQGLADRLVADQVRQQPRLARRDSREPPFGYKSHDILLFNLNSEP